MSITMIILVVWAHQQLIKTLKQRKVVMMIMGDTHDVGIKLGICEAMFMDVLGIKRGHMDIGQGMVMTFNNDSDLLKKVLIGDESWVYGYTW